jgi:DNA-binding SARP family transcriptional activator/TolB-like protein
LPAGERLSTFAPYLARSASASMIRIQTFGGFSVRDDDGRPLSGAAAQPRRMAVLALLARAGDRGIARERIVALLWPDVEEERARNSLAQTLYTLRRYLGGDEIIGGIQELRLDADRVSADVAEFRAAVTRGEDARAAEIYVGHFLDGFHVPGAAELERWIEEERQAFAHDHARVLESLARSATTARDAPAAVTWWRKLAAHDPLNARVAIALMEAMAAAGDRAGALHHARIYETLLEQDLDLPPDRDVVRLAERLRREARDVERERGSHEEKPQSPFIQRDDVPREMSVHKAADESARTAEPAEATSGIPRSVPPSRLVAAIAAAAVLTAAAVGAAAYAWLGRRGAAPTTPVVAVGRIVEYELGTRSVDLTAPLSDLLATNLARVAGLRVVSMGRVLEVMERAADTTTGAFTAAARAAGATDLVDGTLYGRADGRLRLDLRRVDLTTGAIVDARTVEGPDLFALADSGTAHLAVRLGANAPAGSIADATTHSLAAYRLYIEGVRRYYALDLASAERLLGAAVAEDSTFAMAAYYWALATPDVAASAARMERAVRASAAASDRERLMIRAGWALRSSAPELGAVADTLADRYPDEVEGHLYRGAALVMAQEYLAAVPHLRRVMRMDSVALRRDSVHTRAGPCAGCEARSHLIFAYIAVDSLAVAEREAAAWTRLSPRSAAAWLALAGALDARGQAAAALAALDSARRADDGATTPVQDAMTVHWIYVGDFSRAEELLRARVENGTPADQVEAFWYLAILYREWGRLADALAAARRHRAVAAASSGAGPPAALIEGVMLDAMGRHREAATLFDSTSRWRVRGLPASLYGRNRAWSLTQAANARAASGDTAGLLALAETVAVYGAQSAYGRDRRLFHHVRGLAAAARGDDDTAAGEFRASMRSLRLGYTRSNAELARALLRLRRPAEAVAVLQPALEGTIEGSSLYVSRTELHELLARAWEAAGSRDSAAVHYAAVERAWAAGDPSFRARAGALRRGR